MILDLGALLSAGLPFPDGFPCEPAGVVLISTEVGLADTIVSLHVLRPKSGISSEQSRDAGAYAWAYICERLNRREEIEGGPQSPPMTRKEFKMNGSRRVYLDRFPYERLIFLPNAETARSLLQRVAILEGVGLESWRATA